MTVELQVQELLQLPVSPQKAPRDKLEESARTLATECSEVCDETSLSSDYDYLPSPRTPSLSLHSKVSPRLRREKFPSLCPLALLVPCEETKEEQQADQQSSPESHAVETEHARPARARKVYRTPTPDAGFLESMANRPARRYRRVRADEDKKYHDQDDFRGDEVLCFMPAPRRNVYRTPTPDMDILESMVPRPIRRTRRVTAAQRQAAFTLQKAWRDYHQKLQA